MLSSMPETAGSTPFGLIATPSSKGIYQTDILGMVDLHFMIQNHEVDIVKAFGLHCHPF